MRKYLACLLTVLLPATLVYVARVPTAYAARVPTAYAARVPTPDPLQGDGGVSAFYTWTDELPVAPGQMLRSEVLDPALGLTKAGEQYRILYTSIDGIDGKTPVAVSGAYFVPKGDPPAGGWPLVAWAHGTTGVADVCAPSWLPRTKRDSEYLTTWLDQGYAVVATDYQGLGTPGPHPYLAVKPEAYSVLDSVRAVLKGFPHVANRVVLVGQSQGGGAAFATAGIAPDYAPELDIRGSVATGVPLLSSAVPPPAPDAAASEQADPTVAYLLYIGVMIQQGNFTISADRLVTERALPLFDAARSTCVGKLFRDVQQAGLNRGNTLKPAFVAAFLTTLPNLQYSTFKLAQPLFVGTGDKDRDVPPARQLAVVRDACAAGTLVEAHLYAGLDHSATVNGSLKDSLPFVRKVLAGEPISPICEPTAQ